MNMKKISQNNAKGQPNSSFDQNSPLIGISEGEAKKAALAKEYQDFAKQQIRETVNEINPALAKKYF